MVEGIPLQVEAAKSLVGCAMYIDVLKPVSLLSLSLQGNDAVDVVISIENTLKSAKIFSSVTDRKIPVSGQN